MNEAGQVVGYSANASGDNRVFLLDGIMIDLGTVGGCLSVASAINCAGQVAGWARTSSGVYHAFMWDGTMHDLGTLGGIFSWAYDINDAGQVVGEAYTSSGDQHAFVWDGAMHDLGTLGGRRSWAYAVNKVGEIVGYAYTAAGAKRATLWRPPLTPIQRLEQCAASVADLESQGILNKGQTNSLVTKIDGAIVMLEAEKTRPAVNKLGAFQNEARAYVNGRKLTPEQGEELIFCVQGVIDAL